MAFRSAGSGFGGRRPVAHRCTHRPAPAFGSRMIERALATEIGGTAQIDYRPDGVVFTAEAPLPEVLGH